MLGIAIASSGLSPIRLLFIASIAAGIGTPVSLASLLLVAGDRHLMAGRPIGIRLRVAGWAVTAMVTAVSVVYLLQLATRSL
ncbi:MAG TPA: hypothetical protein VIB48_03620 [Acidimicrobiia bacterium]